MQPYRGREIEVGEKKKKISTQAKQKTKKEEIHQNIHNLIHKLLPLLIFLPRKRELKINILNRNTIHHRLHRNLLFPYNENRWPNRFRKKSQPLAKQRFQFGAGIYGWESGDMDMDVFCVEFTVLGRLPPVEGFEVCL